MGRRPLKTFTRTISHFNYLAGQPLSLSQLINTTDNEQQPGPPVHRCLPCRPVKARGYQQGEPSPYLVSRVLLEELDFRGLVTLADNDQGPSTPVHRSYPPCRPVAIPLAGTVGSPDYLPVRTPVDSGSYRQVKPGGVTPDGTLEVVRQRHQRDELKRNNLVSSRWCYATETATRVKYESIHS